MRAGRDDRETWLTLEGEAGIDPGGDVVSPDIIGFNVWFEVFERRKGMSCEVRLEERGRDGNGESLWVAGGTINDY